MNTTDYTRGTAEIQRGLSDNQRKVGGMPSFSPVPAARLTCFDRVERFSQLRGGARVLLQRLAHRWQGKDGSCWEYVSTLAAGCGYSERHMFDCIAQAEASGELYVGSREHKNTLTGRYGNHYLLTVGLEAVEIAGLLRRRLGYSAERAAVAANQVMEKRLRWQAHREQLREERARRLAQRRRCNDLNFSAGDDLNFSAGALLIYEPKNESSSIGSPVVADLGSSQQQQGLLFPLSGIETQAPPLPPLKVDPPARPEGPRPGPFSGVGQPPPSLPSPSPAREPGGAQVGVALRHQAERKFLAAAPANTPKAAPQGPTYAERKAARAALLAGLDPERLALLRALVQITTKGRCVVESLSQGELQELIEGLPEVVELLQGQGCGGEGQPRLVDGLNRWYGEKWPQIRAEKHRSGAWPDLAHVVKYLPGLGREEEADESTGQVWQAYAPDGVLLGAGPVARPENTQASQPDEPTAAARRVWVDVVGQQFRRSEVVAVAAGTPWVPAAGSAGGKPLWRVAVGRELDLARRAQRVLEGRLRVAGHSVALEFVSGAGVVL